MKKQWMIVVIIILLIIIGVMTTILFKQKEPNKAATGVVFEPNTVAGENAQVGTALPGVAIPGWTAIKLSADTLEADVSLHNPDSNAGYYSLSFTLVLADTGEEVFTTGLIEPGFKCSKVPLNVKLKKGEYPAVMFVQPYLQDETQTPLNNAEMEILLIVE